MTAKSFLWMPVAMHGRRERGLNRSITPHCSVNAQGLLGKCGGAAAQ